MKSMGYDIEGGGWSGLTEAAAVARAKSGFDALIAQQGMYKRYVGAMLAANPALQLLAYVNGTHTSNNGFPEKWYMHDRDGTRLRSAPPWDNNFTMMPIDTNGPTATVNGMTADSWNAWKLKDIERIIAESGYTGIYVDELGTGSLVSRDGMGESIDPRTNQPWTRSDYMDDIGVWLARMQDVMPTDQSLTVNGLGTNYRFYGRPLGHKGPFVTDYGSLADGATAPLLEADAAASELYMRGPAQAIDILPKVDWWQCELQMTITAAERLMVLTKTWTTGTQAQKDRWHRLSLATFLLGAHPDAMYYFTYVRATGVTAYHPWWTHAKRLGAPTAGAVVLSSGLYRRQYEGGFSLVNPTLVAQTYRVTRSFTLLGGATLAPNALVTIQSMDGQVFVR